MEKIDPKDMLRALLESIEKQIKNGIRDACNDGEMVFEADTVPSDIAPYVTYQVCYDNPRNRVYIEFDYSEAIKHLYPKARIDNKITSYINSNVYEETSVYPEIILPDDGVHEKVDSSKILTPYVIGYWKCLGGAYEFIYSYLDLEIALRGIAIPKYKDEFNTEFTELYNTYYISDFNKFLSELIKLDRKYNIRLDEGPRKDITQFFIDVRNLGMQYTNPVFTEAQKDDYFAKHTKILEDFGDDPDKYKEEIDKLNAEFNITTEINKKIPEIMDKYLAIYRDFFGKDLPTIHDNTLIKYMIFKN